MYDKGFFYDDVPIDYESDAKKFASGFWTKLNEANQFCAIKSEHSEIIDVMISVRVPKVPFLRTSRLLQNSETHNYRQ